MRANTAAILAAPEFSIITALDGQPCGLLKFGSISHAHEFCKTHARTENEINWTRPAFLGLQSQTLRNFDDTGIAQHPLALMHNAVAMLDQRATRPGVIRNTVSGGTWDIPAVQAGLPLAARSRIRTALPPINIRIFIAYSGGITSEFIAPIAAKIAKALWNYTLAGGAVSLTVLTGCKLENPKCNNRVITEVKVNARDVAALSLAMSPIFMRGITCPIECALSNKDRDRLPLLHNPMVPNLYFMSGIGREIETAAAKVLEALKIK